MTGDNSGAISYAEMAARADETWAEPDFILGWYALGLDSAKAVDCFAKAVEKERGIVFRIAADPECRNYPSIIQSVKDRAAEAS